MRSARDIRLSDEELEKALKVLRTHRKIMRAEYLTTYAVLQTSQKELTRLEDFKNAEYDNLPSLT